MDPLRANIERFRGAYNTFVVGFVAFMVYVYALTLAAGVLPGVAAWCLAMISVFEFKRRASLYRQLVDELTRLRPKIAAASCASEVGRAMNQIERLLLNELWEWQGSRRK